MSASDPAAPDDQVVPEPHGDGASETCELAPSESPAGSGPEPPLDVAAITPEVPPAGETPADPRPVPEPAKTGDFDLDRPDLYLNRELTWLNFNFRVLALARDPRTPLLERLSFISIVGTNLDEFFRKRVGELKRQAAVGVGADGRTPQDEMEEAYGLIRLLVEQQREILGELEPRLAAHGIVVCDADRLEDDARKELRQRYVDEVFPLVTPHVTDPAHPFPAVPNLSLNLLVTLRPSDEDGTSLALVTVPVGGGVPRFMSIEDGSTFVPLESVVADNLDLLFPGLEIVSVDPFRITRNAEAEIEPDVAEDLLAHVETKIHRRRLAPIVRLEVGVDMDPAHRALLGTELGLDRATDLFEVEGLINLGDLAEIAALEIPNLRYPPHQPLEPPLLAGNQSSIFDVVRENGSLLTHHPYESFSASIERFLAEASTDPDVRAIKMTVYRTSADSRAVDFLIEAARNDKQVTVVVELTARFDEAANIRWANQLSAYGIHVTYGVMGLKTHCKAILVVRQEGDALRSYVHVGTGNYHAETARIYSDLGLLTCDDEIGSDVTGLFNFLTTGYSPRRNYKKLLPAPLILAQALTKKIDRERQIQEAGGQGLIQLKMNALEDPGMVRKLYEAARAGVKIDLIVRDTCRLRPGIPGLSEGVRVFSIVGRFLEHSRIYYFRNDGEEEYFIGSADLMRRNLENRVEVLVPVEPKRLRDELRTVLDVQLNDTISGWEMRSDGSYVQRADADQETGMGTHERLIAWTADRQRDTRGFKRRRPRLMG